MLLPAKFSTIFLLFCSLGLLSTAGCTGQPTQADNSATSSTKIVGWVEKGQISGLDEEIKFKLDTGATTSSINAEIIEQPDAETESGGMIKFRFRDGEEVSQIYELPVARWVKIESRTQDFIRRPVVRMKMCVAGSWIEEEVNLAERDDFNYSVLVGRNLLKKGKLAVDSSQTFTQDPGCPTEEEQQ
ncbi:MAG: RimK/LysX family protein [Oscillatoria sp. PMC 1068.18]|nr:RimK/LysX family protein [Oscillatoria sp. PMC 1076.18]MEC4989685.1 RimK/LysX family protein [Oscillatoria sp. PMC 1068.18]